MAKTPSTRLFDLVKSLSGSEKRYFKLATKKDGDSKYLQLFEAIEEQVDFDDILLKEIVYKRQEVRGKKFSELKAYLYDLILKNLQQFDEQNSVDYQLKSLLLSVRSMFRRLRYKDCKYLLTRAKKIALRYEKFTIVLEVIDWEKDLAYARSDVDYFDKHLISIRKEEEECLAKMMQVKTYESLFYELFLVARTNTPQAIKQKQKVEQLAAHPLMESNEIPTSFHAKVLYYRIQAILSYQRREVEKFYIQSGKLIPLIESKPFLLKEDSSLYISALNNLIVSCGFTLKYDELRDSLKKLKKVRPNTKDDELKIHRQYYTNYFRLCINTGEFTEGLIILKRHLKEVKKLDSRLFERNIFLFQYFYIHFGNGNFDQALAYLNKWLDLPRSVEQKGLQILARIFNLIIHYEMGNSILLDSLLKSTQRSLQKSKNYNAFEHLLFNCLRQANHLINKTEIKNIFADTVEELKSTKWSEKERAILRLFYFEEWLLSKAREKTFAKIIQERVYESQSLNNPS